MFNIHSPSTIPLFVFKLISSSNPLFFFFFFTDTATTEIYTLSLHDALPICSQQALQAHADADDVRREHGRARRRRDHRSEEHTSELQSRENLVCRLLLEKKKKKKKKEKMNKTNQINSN